MYLFIYVFQGEPIYCLQLYILCCFYCFEPYQIIHSKLTAHLTNLVKFKEPIQFSHRHLSSKLEELEDSTAVWFEWVLILIESVIITILVWSFSVLVMQPTLHLHVGPCTLAVWSINKTVLIDKIEMYMHA